MERDKIYKILIDAKEIYESRDFLGMCICLRLASHLKYEPSEIIPEFNSEYLEAAYPDGIFWWDTHDYKSREKAFDKLIAIYSKKVKEGSLSYKITKFIKEKYEKMFKVCKAS